jgi:hypothetical protein
LAVIACISARFNINGFASAKISELSITELSFFVLSAVSLTIVGAVLLAMKLCVGLQGKILTALVVIAQITAIAGFGILRQLGQNIQLQQYVISTQLLPIAWEAFIPFLIIFVIGAIVVGWMIRQIVVAKNNEAT